MLKSGLLSLDHVIQYTNEHFTPVSYMILEDVFPSNVPALQPMRAGYLAQKEYHGFFSTIAVVDPSGKWLLGYTGRSYPPNFKPGGCYDEDHFLANLKQSLVRYEHVRAIESDSSISENQKSAKIQRELAPVLRSVEILKSLHGEMEQPGTAPGS